MASGDFEKVMSELGYEFDEQEGNKFTYKKRTQFSELVLVFDLESKYINPVLVPVSLVIHEHDLGRMILDLRTMRSDAELIAGLSKNKFKVLN